MPHVSREQLTGLSSLSDQLDQCQRPEARHLLKQYGQVVLAKLIGEAQDMRRLSLYDDHLRRADDQSLGLDMPGTPEEEDLRIDSPTTTINHAGTPPWATLAVAAGMALGGLGGGAALMSMLARPAAPVARPAEPAAPVPGPGGIDASVRATIE